MWGIPKTHLSLEEYWQFLQISEPAGYGIRNAPAEITQWACSVYWNQDERYHLAVAIAKAEKRFKSARHLGYPIRREYIGPEQYPYAWPLILRSRWVRQIGVERETTVKSGQAITLSTGGVIHDPVSFTVEEVAFTDPDEVVIYCPDQTTYTIRPSVCQITLQGDGTYDLYVEIPRSRLLKTAYFINYESGLTGYEDADRPNYETDANFLTSVDVVRNYVLTTTGNNLVWWRPEPGTSCLPISVPSCEPSTPCAETLQLACAYVVDQKLGTAQYEPATYSSGWVRASYSVNREPDGIQTNYMAGRWDRYDEIDEQMVRAIIAVAHNNLAEEYCTCNVQKRYYDEDTRPIEPPVRLSLGPSTWGIYEASEIVHEEKIVQGMFI